jgi:prevent-host-death family protein
MRVIGIRDLKRSLSQTMRAVGRGEHVRVTLRGRPVADIVPAGASSADDRVRRLVAEGRLVPPAHGHPHRAPKLVKAARPASAIVLAEREAGT